MPTLPSEAQVRERAYDLWQQEGCPDGCAERHWQQAEQELRALDDAGQVGTSAPASSRRATKRSASAK